MTKLRSQVIAFHEAFGVPVNDTPGIPDMKRIQLRLRLIAEEFCELMAACGANVGSVEETIAEAINGVDTSKADLVEIADALGDIDYVCEGSRLELGINGEPIADEIHRSNIAKAGGETRADGKIQKPTGWTPPDIAGELRKQGWAP